VWTSSAFTAGFCERWLEKASDYDDSSLDGAFDRFFSLFVAFSRLYSHFAVRSGCTYEGDRRQATACFARAMGEGDLAPALEADGGRDDMRTLADLIAPGGGFYVASKRNAGGPDPDRNRLLNSALCRGNASQRVMGLLCYLYLVRCNMFHGHKDFDNAQLRIIQPSARCLERIVRAGLDKVRADPG